VGIEKLKDFVEEYPDHLRGHVQLSAALYHAGKYHEGHQYYLPQGQINAEAHAHHSGRDIFTSRIIGDLSWGFSIGHTSLLDPLIKAQKLGLLSPEPRTVLHTENVANAPYLDYFRDFLDVNFITAQESNALFAFNSSIFENISCWKFKSGYVDLYSALNQIEKEWQSQHQPPLLQLREDHQAQGESVLQLLGMPKDGWFVTLHVREGDTQTNTANANASISSYRKAISAITDRGGWVIRMGHPGMRRLSEVPRVVDYANSPHKSAIMDVFLWASTRFHIGTASGPLTVPPTFGRPVLYTNAPALGLTVDSQNSRMLPKLWVSSKNGRKFTFEQMLESPIGWTVSRNLGPAYEIVDNSAEDLEFAIIEMLDMTETLEGQVPPTDLQILFGKMQARYGNTSRMQISKSFVERHDDLIA
jgi:putative glycosyltransferase (TIGR04372 family)